MVLERIDHWLNTLVIGLNLCPFASRVKRQGLLRVHVADGCTAEGCLQELADEANRLEAGDDRATTLLVLSAGFDDFDDYLDLLALAEALLEDLGFTGVLQLASFHPQYQFDGTELDDVGNWTNRAPFPILHLLQEKSLAEAVDAHSDPGGIPARNIRTLEELGIRGVESLLLRLH